MEVLDASFARFAYPFTFAAQTFGARVEAVNAYRLGGDCRLWCLDALPTAETLPHVGDHLNPFQAVAIRTKDRIDDLAAAHRAGAAAGPLTRRAVLDAEARGRADEAESLSQATAVAWCLDDNLGVNAYRALGGRAQWQMDLRGRSEPLPFCFRGVQLVLFRHGVGLLVWDVRPDRKRLPVDTDPLVAWLDLIHFFRHAAGHEAPQLYAWEHYARDTRRPFRPFQPRPGPPAPASAEPAPGSDKADRFELAVLFDDLLRAAVVSHDCLPPATVANPARWWQPIYVPRQMLCYYCLLVDGVAAGGAALADLGGWRGVRVRVRNQFHSRQAIHPSKADLADDHPSLVPYAQDQDFLVTMQGGGYLSADPPPTDFFRNVIADHVGKEYYLLFLLAVHQRFTLAALQRQVSRRWLDRPRRSARERAFRRIYSAMLAFHARGYHVQVMQREHHHRVYQRWQDVFQLARINAEMTDQLQRMYTRTAAEHEAQLKRRADRTERLLGWLTFVIGVPGLLIGLAGVSVEGYTVSGRVSERVGMSAVAALLATAAVVYAWVLVPPLRRWAKGLRRRRRRTRRRQRVRDELSRIAATRGATPTVASPTAR